MGQDTLRAQPGLAPSKADWTSDPSMAALRFSRPHPAGGPAKVTRFLKGMIPDVLTG